ncbi:L-2-hydroxyglutarate dehydrogenase, mitochondrial [Coccomyxa sp. Obi]|nr:L-2-hydroxyglutarate dehydrogenase, mitochondrial [Coccomyxa sp. Obi]
MAFGVPILAFRQANRCLRPPLYASALQSRLQTTANEASNVDAIVVGAGVVGLAVARSLAHEGREVVVLESASDIGTSTSSRNSEVIHAGIYYPPGSLKARLCVEGRNRIYEYCEAHGVPHKRIGKILVAADESQLEDLRRYKDTALKNGVELEWLEVKEAKAREPALRCVAALWSSMTGIVDSHQLMLGYQSDAEKNGAAVALNSSLISGDVSGAKKELRVADSKTGEVSSLTADVIINAAGLQAQEVAASLAGFPQDKVPRRYLARGCYFTLAGKSPFRHLIYPMPENGGLGAHLTLDLANQAKFGPDVEWVDSIDYTVDPKRADRFYSTIRHYWPGLPDGSLQPSYSGIRPKISGPGDKNADFLIQGPADHGIDGLVNLFGIESPGLTASMSIGDYVADLLKQ